MNRISPFYVYLLVILSVFGFGSYQQGVVLPEMRRQTRVFEGVSERLDRIEESLALLHFKGDPDGKPLGGILAHLKYWAGQLAEYGSSSVERPIIQKKIRRGVKALLAVGDRAIPTLREAFFAKENSTREANEFRRQLLFAMKDLGSGEAQKLATELLEDFRTPSMLRVVAAHLLLGIDSRRAGEILMKILLRESPFGPRQITTEREHWDYRPASFPGYQNLVSYFLQSSYPGKADVLLSILERPTNDVVTLNTIVGGLQELASKSAIEPLKRVFRGTQLVHRDPTFRRNCLIALTELAGPSICPWLVERYAEETDPNIQHLFRSLIANNCR
ncbi:MAG: HEAT repeat domain-containing protein [Planctomycetota bacterium]